MVLCYSALCPQCPPNVISTVKFSESSLKINPLLKKKKKKKLGLGQHTGEEILRQIQ
jgi:hypothetical protein